MRLFGRETAANIFFGEQLDVGIELLGEVVFATPAGEAAEQAVPDTAQRARHTLTHFSAMKRAMISAACAHCVTSEARCFRPALVIRQNLAPRVLTDTLNSPANSTPCSTLRRTGYNVPWLMNIIS